MAEGVRADSTGGTAGRETAGRGMVTEELFEAVRKGDLEKVQAEVSARPELANCRNESGASLVLFAIYNGRPDIARFLRKAGAEIGIFEAAALGDLARIDELVAADGTALNSFSPDGFQPLGLACFFKHEMTAQYLIEKGADPSSPSRNDQKVTALHSAAASGSRGLVELLLQSGADTSAKTEKGETPADIARARGFAQIAELLEKRPG